jgi:CBS domain-containing protein
MATQISSQHSPYVIGRPIYDVESFFGRDELFEFIEDNLVQKSQIILLHGQRRIGKSSVLLQIPNFVRLDSFVFIHLTLEGQTGKPLGALLSTLAREIVNQLERCPERLNQKLILPGKLEFIDQPDKFSDEFLPKIYAALGDSFPVFLLDEFDELEEQHSKSIAEDFFYYLKSTLPYHSRLHIIAVVGRRLDELPKLLNLFGGAPYREVGLLGDSDARELIVQPAKDILDYSSDAIDAILSLTERHPFCTQLICDAIFSYLRKQNRYKVERADVESCLHIAIESGEAGLIWFSENLPTCEKVIFSAVAKMNMNKHSSPFDVLEKYGIESTAGLQDAEENLIKWNFLVPRQAIEGSYGYKIAIPMVGYWLNNRNSIRSDTLKLEDVSETAQNIYESASHRNFSSNPHEYMDLCKQVLRLNPNHFRALFDLARHVLASGNHEEAYQLYKRVYQVDPVRSKTLFLKSISQYVEELVDKGEDSLAGELIQEGLAIEYNHQQLTELLKLVQDTSFDVRDSRDARDSVRKIMVPKPEVVTVNSESKFSELHYKMTVLGISHCPVIDVQSGQCIRIITRRDFVDKIPPSYTALPDGIEATYSIKLDKEKFLEEIKRLGSSSIGEIFPEIQTLISLPDDSPIQQAIDLFSIQHHLRSEKRYVTALPILDAQKRLNGFISYVDVFKKFIKNQSSFLSMTVDKIGVPSEKLTVLTDDMTLADAHLLFSVSGVRSMPVVKQENIDEVIGMLESVQIKMYMHKLFEEELMKVGVKHLMTPIGLLHTPSPESFLSESISKFWEPINGLIRVSSFAICEERFGNKKLRGMISYIDILKEWQQWYKNNRIESAKVTKGAENLRNGGMK